jgi:hypothetical protein
MLCYHGCQSTQHSNLKGFPWPWSHKLRGVSNLLWSLLMFTTMRVYGGIKLPTIMPYHHPPTRLSNKEIWDFAIGRIVLAIVIWSLLELLSPQLVCKSKRTQYVFLFTSWCLIPFAHATPIDHPKINSNTSLTPTKYKIDSWKFHLLTNSIQLLNSWI